MDQTKGEWTGSKLADCLSGSKRPDSKVGSCVREWITTLIEILDETIDAILMPVIQRATIKHGSKLFIKLGDKV